MSKLQIMKCDVENVKHYNFACKSVWNSTSHDIEIMKYNIKNESYKYVHDNFDLLLVVLDVKNLYKFI